MNLPGWRGRETLRALRHGLLPQHGLLDRDDKSTCQNFQFRLITRFSTVRCWKVGTRLIGGALEGGHMCTLAPLLLLVVTLPLQAQEPATDSTVPIAQGYAPGAPRADAPPVSARTGMDRSTVVSVTVLPLRSETQLREALSNSETDLRRSEAR